jgi:predicted nucleic acid-binding protein
MARTMVEELEVLAWVAGGAEHRAMIDSLERSYPRYPDLVIAVTAERHGLTALHDDNDYEAISRVTGLPVQRVTD